MYLLTHFENAREFVDYIDTMSNKKKVGEEEDGLNAVQPMTIHRSKGLEFKVVIGVGLNEGVLPHNKSVEKELLGDESAIEEERRLAYVLGTRAEIQLFLSSTEYYNGKYAEPSRFIYEMGLFEEEKEEEQEQEEDLARAWEREQEQKAW
jgi:DNA helicase-2/ATP-dependent DNA helicase PcrA